MAVTTMKDLAAKNGPVMNKDKSPLSTFIRSKISQTLTGRKGEEFVTAVVSLVSHNPALAICDRTTLCTATLQAQSLGLSLNQQLGQAWIIPYENRKKNIMEATFQIGYRGYIQLAIRSGQYKKLNVLPIKEGELKYFDPLNEELDVELIQNEIERAKTPSIGYYAMFEYLNGFRKAIYWTREKMMEHAKTYSPAFAKDLRSGGSYSFWSKDFDAMACKTMLRQLITKWGIMSVDMEKALDADTMTSHETVSEDVLDVPLEMPGEDAIDVESSEPVEDKPRRQKRPEKKTEPASNHNEAVPQEAELLEAPSASTNPSPKLTPGDILCPLPMEDGSQRIVDIEKCDSCPSREDCPAHEPSGMEDMGL